LRRKALPVQVASHKFWCFLSGVVTTSKENHHV
jgi:hypothetical protein